MHTKQGDRLLLYSSGRLSGQGLSQHERSRARYRDGWREKGEKERYGEVGKQAERLAMKC